MGHFGKRGHFEGIPVGGPFSDEKNSKNTPPPEISRNCPNGAIIQEGVDSVRPHRWHACLASASRDMAAMGATTTTGGTCGQLPLCHTGVLHLPL